MEHTKTTDATNTTALNLTRRAGPAPENPTPAPAGKWVSVTDELPPLGVPVHVDGDYVAPGTGHPLSYLCECGYGHNGKHFESSEWRGTVAIRRWWKPATMPDTNPSAAPAQGDAPAEREAVG